MSQLRPRLHSIYELRLCLPPRSGFGTLPSTPAKNSREAPNDRGYPDLQRPTLEDPLYARCHAGSLTVPSDTQLWLPLLAICQ